MASKKVFNTTYISEGSQEGGIRSGRSIKARRDTWSVLLLYELAY